MYDYQTPADKDPHLWRLAQKRASFRSHLATYIAINIFLWLIWYLTSDANDLKNKIPWPVWSTAGWGIGVFFHYIGAYVSTGKDRVEKEYEKLKQQNKL